MLTRQLSLRIKEINVVNNENKSFKLSGESCESSLLDVIRSLRDSRGNETINSLGAESEAKTGRATRFPRISPIGRSAREPVPHSALAFRECNEKKRVEL